MIGEPFQKRHRVIKSNPEAWLKLYIEKNIEVRKNWAIQFLEKQWEI